MTPGNDPDRNPIPLRWLCSLGLYSEVRQPPDYEEGPKTDDPMFWADRDFQFSPSWLSWFNTNGTDTEFFVMISIDDSTEKHLAIKRRRRGNHEYVLHVPQSSLGPDYGSRQQHKELQRELYVAVAADRGFPPPPELPPDSPPIV